MPTKKPYEMNFVEFAEAIQPGWSSGLGSIKRSSDDPVWLTSVWSSADKRGVYGVYWHNDRLKNELPPEAKRYQFEDLSLHPFTERLGLNPEVENDNIKASMLLAVRNAWLASIQHHYGQPATAIHSCTLSSAVAVEYVLLSSGFNHPWIKEQIRQHIAEQNRKRMEQDSKPKPPVELSNDPNWPGAQVIHVRATKLTPNEQAMREERLKDIRHWLDKFKFEDGCCTSIFELRAFDAQSDIDIANQKIVALQQIIEKQRALIQSADKIITKNKRHEAEMRASNKLGRPEKSPERQKVAIQFTTQWVQSLMDAFDVKSCAQLESTIYGSSQRSWRRWLNGDAVPTHKNLSELLIAEIKLGIYKGKPLHDVPTNPEHNDLLALISMT